MSYLLQEQQNLIVSTADSMTVAHNVFWIFKFMTSLVFKMLIYW